VGQPYKAVFQIAHRRLIKIWKDLQLHRADNIIKSDGTDYTDADILEYFDARYEQSSRGDYYLKQGLYPAKPASILKDWHAILNDTPRSLLDAVREDQGETWRYSDAAVGMMRALGWRPGDGLGKTKQGRKEPIDLGKRRRSDTGGLGYSGPADAAGDAPQQVAFVRASTKSHQRDTPTLQITRARKPRDKLRSHPRGH
jgi:hypothetical protein